ncbi:helix-turn-helix transcriptional regulator [Fulvivirga sp. 29W222]|uniref:Helix-turn-helix transcriptional regulator n=1 Tax=Fulvivirga marina TaxID=2494733 RepID=A0A937KF95_9BACT|nr:helix-turn-helix domain-containing protein [Fulvivirga marina]MBL6447963.1 helix-turn-helix transcriptional regulator [Fulvivirga marina]
MSIVEMSKVLSNKARVDVLAWLKNPEKNFPPQVNVPNFDDGVCVCHIQNKLGLSQSTTSHYLSMMEKAGLLIGTRIGKWTYYKRNEEQIEKFIQSLSSEL